MTCVDFELLRADEEAKKQISIAGLVETESAQSDIALQEKIRYQRRFRHFSRR